MLLDDIEHLPKVVTNVLGIKDVLLAIEPEIIQLRKDISDLIKELYVKTTEEFITRWEKDFSLKYDASLTLEQRRQRILNKLARKRPLTWDNLRLLIKNNLAENVQFYLSNDSANYHFRIIINPEMEEVFDLSKFTVVGSPTITDDGIASGFSSSDYITTPTIKAPATQYELLVNMNTPISISSNCAIVDGRAVGIQDALFYFALNYNNGRPFYQFALGTSKSGDITGWKNLGSVDLGKNVTFKFTWNGSEYRSYKSVDNGDFIEVGSVTTSSTALLSMTHTIGAFRGGSSPFAGSIDLKQFSITVDGKEVFSGTKRVPKGISEMEKAVRQAKPAYLTFDILVTDIVRRCGTFNCGTNPL